MQEVHTYTFFVDIDYEIRWFYFIFQDENRAVEEIIDITGNLI